jgi:H+/gluconate symporter-like permease
VIVVSLACALARREERPMVSMIGILVAALFASVPAESAVDASNP